MPYIIETIKTGKVVETRKTYSARFGRKIPRSGNINLTPPDVEEVNLRNAERKLRWLINTNFGEGDFHIVLGYAKDINRTPEEAKKDLENFMRGMRKLYQNANVPFKYISTTERGQHGQKKMHHHLVINYFDTRKISALWPWGRIKFNPLDDTGQYGKLANYLIKRTSKTFNSGEGPYKKRWNQSRNLVIPIPHKKVVSHEKWMKEPKALKGYYIEKDSIFNGVSKVTGYPMQFYSMVLLFPAKIKRRI